MLLHVIFQACRSLVSAIVKHQLLCLLFVLLIALVVISVLPLRGMIMSSITDPWPPFVIPGH